MLLEPRRTESQALGRFICEPLIFRLYEELMISRISPRVSPHRQSACRHPFLVGNVVAVSTSRWSMKHFHRRRGAIYKMNKFTLT